MIEVEAKIKISNPSEYRKKIKTLAKYIGKEKKIDSYYTNLPVSTYPKRSFRIRKHPNYYEINSKVWLSYIKGVYAKQENEIKVKDISSFVKEIKTSGFKLWLKKEKLTELYQIKKNFHIELNKIKHLGWFLEIEYLTNKKQIPKARKSIIEIMKSLDIKQNQIIKTGYTRLLWNLKKKH